MPNPTHDHKYYDKCHDGCPEIRPNPGEVWQEADGCCLTYAGDGGWFAFGVAVPFLLQNEPLVILPLRRLLLSDGTIAPERIDDC